ncbi:MAG: hypothetical protein KHY72_09985 [Streptococcus agalactiae]|nr:hypothetical protein [Streptococcus agalactiae]
MSNVCEKVLINMKEFIYDCCSCADDECPLWDICDKADGKGMTHCLCKEEDEKYISIIKELGGDDK